MPKCLSMVSGHIVRAVAERDVERVSGPLGPLIRFGAYLNEIGALDSYSMTHMCVYSFDSRSNVSMTLIMPLGFAFVSSSKISSRPSLTGSNGDGTTTSFEITRPVCYPHITKHPTKSGSVCLSYALSMWCLTVLMCRIVLSYSVASSAGTSQIQPFSRRHELGWLNGVLKP